MTALTDETGEVVTIYDYNAYGEFNQRGKDIDNPFTYFGQYYDKETGHYYLRARYYNPSTMRFTQEDTYTGKASDPLSLNRYLYAVGNPVMFVDPSGYRPHNSSRRYFGSTEVPDGYHKREITRQGMVYTVPYSPELKAQAEKASITGTTLILGDIYDIQLILIGYDFEEKRWATKGERAFYASLAIVPGSVKLIKNGGDAVANKFLRETLEGTGETVAKYWDDAVEFSGNKVYQRSDLFDPDALSSWKVKGKKVTGTNVERMASGRAPIGYDGKSVNLHHMTQTQSGAIAEVSETFHQANKSIIHINPSTTPSGINRNTFNTWRGEYWTNRANDFMK